MPKKTKFKKWRTVLPKIKFTTVLILVLVILVILNYSKVTYSSKNPNPTQPTPTRTNRPFTENWNLERTVNGKTETLGIFSDTYDQNLLRWGDYLFYANQNYSNDSHLYSLNLKTGENKVIYDQSTRNDFPPEKFDSRYINDLQVIDNTLYFSVGGYMTSSADFAVPLPPVSGIKKLSNTDSIYHKTNINDLYFIVNGFGDACFGADSYSLVDFKTKKVTKIVDSVSGCSEGEEYIGMDNSDRLIMAGHHSYEPIIYDYILAVPLANPSTKVGLIAKQNMPTNINKIWYFKDKNQLVLEGIENYIFDIQTNQITKTDKKLLPKEPTVTSNYNRSFKDKIKELNLPHEFQFNLKRSS